MGKVSLCYSIGDSYLVEQGPSIGQSDGRRTGRLVTTLHLREDRFSETFVGIIFLFGIMMITTARVS